MGEELYELFARLFVVPSASWRVFRAICKAKRMMCLNDRVRSTRISP